MEIPITNMDNKQRISSRNLGEDTVKYLLNLDVSSSYYDPMTKTMREDTPLHVYNAAFSLLLERNDGALFDESVLLQLEELMERGDTVEVLFCLLEHLKTSLRKSSRSDVLLRLISKCVEDCLEETIVETCNPSSNDLDSAEEFIQLLVSIPSRTAPFLEENNVESILLRTNYFRHLSHILHKGLCHAHSRIKSSQNASLSFFGLLIGKIVTSEQPDFVTSLLLTIARNGKEDFIWRRIAQLLFKHIPARAYETILLKLLPMLDDGQLLTYFLGCRVDDPQMELVLTKRLFFNRIIPPPRDVVLYRNILGFFCALDDDAVKLKQVVESLLESWATVYGQKYMALEYEMSLTKAILIAVGILRTCIPPDASYGQRLLKQTMHGVQKRLGSTDNKVRLNGMLIGEAVTQMIQPSPENYLKFDYVEDTEIKSLKSLLECRPSESSKDATTKHPEWTKISDLPEITLEFHDRSSTKTIHNNTAEEIDSDDELIPYNSLPESKLKTKNTIMQPKYIQDCFVGLGKQDDVAHRISCLRALPGLIAKQPDTAEHMTVDILKALLGMELEGSLREAISDRLEALITITAQFPKLAGAYLGNEAINRNYSIGIRLEILHVLRSSVERLTSQPSSAPAILDISAPLSNNDAASKTMLTTINNSKTRRNASATKPVIATKNRLTNVARLYILPLLLYGSSSKTSFTILSTEEALLLSHLISTLGLLVHYSRNLTDTRELATRVMEFVWEFRQHSDAAVKQAVLYCISILVQAIPLDFLSKDNRLVDQVRSFLSDVAHNDPHSKSVNMALQIEMMLDHSLQKALLPIRNNVGEDFRIPSSSASVHGPVLSLDMIRNISLSTTKLSF